MGIASVEPLFEGRSGSQSWKFRRTGSRTFEVITDDVNTTEAEVLSAIHPEDASKKIPNYGDSHPGLPTAVCVDKEAEQDDETPFRWFVRVEYDSEPETGASQEVSPTGEGTNAGEKPGNRVENPLNRPAQWKLGSVDRTDVVREWVPVLADGTPEFVVPPDWATAKLYRVGKYVKNGGNVYRCVVSGTSAAGPAGVGPGLITDGTAKWVFWSTLAAATTDPRAAIRVPVLTSGHIPMNPPNTTEVTLVTIIITKNLPSVDPFYASRIRNAVNAFPWKGLPARVFKVLKFDAQGKDEGEFKFAEATWEVGIDPETWDLRPMDQGFGTLELTMVPDPDNPGMDKEVRRYIAHKDPSGEPVSEPVAMNGAGSQLEPDEDPVFLRGVPAQMGLIDFAEYIPW